MRIILNNCDQDYILACRAALSTIKNAGLKVGEVNYIGFTNGSEFAIKVNKNSVSVYKNA